MVFAGLLEKIRVKKKALALTAFDHYYALLKNVATGQEVDADQAAVTIDAIGKSEDDFESDIVTMEKRIGLAGRLRESESIEKSIPGLRETHRIAKDALEAAILRLQPAATAAFDLLKNTEDLLGHFHGVGLRLAETCLDESLKAKEREITGKRVAFVDKRRPLMDDLRLAREYLSNYQANIDDAKRKQQSQLRYARDQATVDLRKWTKQHDAQSSIIDQLEKSIAEIDVELRPLDQEMAKIRKQKLVP